MNAVALLRNQLTAVHGMYAEVVGSLTPDEWVARTHPQGNPPGFLAWHMAATRDWAAHIWCQGVPQVRTSSAISARPGINPACPPFGMSVDEAVTIAAQVSRDDVLAYADAVHASTIAFLDGLTDADLDSVPDTRSHNSLVSPQTADYLEEVDDMYDYPIWRTLSGPCFGHARGHLAEILMTRELLRPR